MLKASASKTPEDWARALELIRSGKVRMEPLLSEASFITLEEIQESAFLLHVVDITHPRAGAQADVVTSVLGELDLATKPRILVLNKTDLLDQGAAGASTDAFSDLASAEPRSVLTSALTGNGLDRLLTEMDGLLVSQGVPAAIIAGAPSG